MMDTRSHPRVIHSTEGFDGRIHVQPRPSFGLGSLRRRKRLLGIGTIACLAIAALYVGLRPATYTASSQLLIYIRQILTGPDQAILPGRADLPMVQNQIELLRSGNVLAKAVDALHLAEDPEFTGARGASPEPPIAAQGQPSPGPAANGPAYRAVLGALSSRLGIRQVGTSHIVTVNFKATDPGKAARIVNTIVHIYQQELARASDAVSSRAPTLREIYQSLGPSAQVLSVAEPPIRRDGPPATLILAAAAFFGLSTAAMVAILLDAIDDTIRTEHQMEYVLGLECLGAVPRFREVGAWAEDAAALRLLASERPALQRAAAMMQDVSTGGLQMLGVTSVLPGEGATTLAISLAKAAAAAGKRVLLVDAVPENPSLSRWIASLSQDPPSQGADLRAEALDGIVEVQPGLHVLPLAERLGGGDRLMPRGLLEYVLSVAENSYDLAIVDLPSLTAGPQARAAASSLDGFFLVVEWGATPSELVRQAFQSAGEARSKFIGAILNMADEEAMKRYGQERPAAPKPAAAS